ncbi:MAG: DNA gyrase subunit A [Gammaproteobacteria bacterium]|nr:DNA gyrase subunit A [Gammaproteobacteria bacterium]MBP9728863.1 DNA gyrase subunit A [Gammaproteobacteria bacterium]
MSDISTAITPVSIEDELKQSYLDYAMSIIVGRALPDVRDGLKPVHRRVLFAMRVLGNDWNKAYKKSARVVGDVIGKYHPHGDTAVYDSIVRMAQPFSLRYRLVDGQGNFGSVDGDSPAAMRYTEVRMSKIAHHLLADLDKETVDFAPNYDGSEWMPTVLPAAIPNLLINGGSGIAVGMATNIPPHNLSEVIDACLALIDDPTLSIDQLMQFIPAPDFPTAGIINGRAGIIEGYKTGRGRAVMRARTNIEVDDKNNKQSIIVTELPFQVNKARLIEKIAELVKDKKIDGITALRDESDKDGMRIVIELRRGEIAEVVINNLYTQTPLQTAFGINMVALVDGQPRTLTLKELLVEFLKHRRQVVSRRTAYELRKSRERAHILEGLGIALANIDPVIQLIKASGTPAEAKTKLIDRLWMPGMVSDMLERAGASICRPEDLSMAFGLQTDASGYRLSAIQAQAILDLRLHRLTGLEQEKILEEFKGIIVTIQDLLAILSDQQRLMQVIRTELEAIKAEFGDARRSEILVDHQDLSTADLIAEEDRVVTLSHSGYVKAQALSSYAAQHRGGKGKAATKVKETDHISKLLIANTHDTLLCFSSLGKVYWMKVYEIPVAARTAQGRPIVNLLPLQADERISALLSVQAYTEDKMIFMATAQGTVKKVPLTEFMRPRSNGIIALQLDEGDALVGVDITDGTRDIMLFSNVGKCVRFPETDVRAMGRTARGVRGIRLQEGQTMISLIVLKPGGAILTATEHGYGKRTLVEEFPAHGRGGQGVIAIQTSDRNGRVVGAVQAFDQDELILISDAGTLVRTRVDEISVVGRNTQGVRLIHIGEAERLVEIQRIEEVDLDLSACAEPSTDL